MDTELLRCAVASFQDEIHAKHGVDLLSRAFLFDQKFARERNRVAELGSYNVDPLPRPFVFVQTFAPPLSVSTRRTTLSVLLREAMTDQARAEIFPGKFDLGNLRTVADEECTYEALSDELNEELPQRCNREGGEIVLDRDTFKTIQQGIFKLTGQKIAAYDRIDKLVALKVVKLLYLVMLKRDKPSLFGLLAAPEGGRAGLEYREAYPNAKNEESTWLVADIKEYLGVELAGDRIKEIEIGCSSLMSAFDRVVSNVDRKIGSSRQSSQRGASVYASLAEVLDNFRWEPELQEVSRLDEALYIYLSTLEFRHYAGSYPSLVEIATPSQQELQMASIERDLDQLAQHMVLRTLGLPEMVDTSSVRKSDCRIQLKLFPRAATNYAHEIRAVMGKALCMPIEEKAYQQCIPDAQKLLTRVCVFETGQPPLEDKVSASLAQVVAAFCAVYFERKILTKRTNHKPYWHAQKAEGGSLLGSLDKPFTDADVLEEHSQIWRCRLEWFQAAICGYLDVHVSRMAFRIALVGKISEIARMNNTEALAKNLIDLLDLVKAKCFAMVDAT
ncbi:hypothetical protein KBK24_0119765 [Burkholderia sp. K24]|jgi:hypothetical protein|nr:hypothetical protein KBK24_0119765 [Burkholderia sp. K24]